MLLRVKSEEYSLLETEIIFYSLILCPLTTVSPPSLPLSLCPPPLLSPRSTPPLPLLRKRTSTKHGKNLLGTYYHIKARQGKALGRERSQKHIKVLEGALSPTARSPTECQATQP